MSFNEGPYIQAACFCSNVIQATDGTFSIIRFIDTLWHQEAGPNPPEAMPPFPFQLQLVLMLKSGKAQGRHEVKIVPELPNGETEPAMMQTVYFEGEEKGVNIITQYMYVFRLEGLYWFKVLVDNDEITRIPLRTRYSRQVIQVPTPPPPM